MKKERDRETPSRSFGRAAQRRAERYVTHTTQSHTVPIQSGLYNATHWFTNTHQHCSLMNSSDTIPYITELYHFNTRLYLTEPVRHQTSQYQTSARQSAQCLDHTLLNCPVTIRDYTHIVAMLMHNEASPIQY